MHPILERTKMRKSAGLIPDYAAVPPAKVLVTIPPTNRLAAPCVKRGEQTGDVECPTCSGNVLLKTFACEVYGTCTLVKAAPGVRGCCDRCPEYVPRETRG